MHLKVPAKAVGKSAHPKTSGSAEKALLGWTGPEILLTSIVWSAWYMFHTLRTIKAPSEYRVVPNALNYRSLSTMFHLLPSLLSIN